MEKITKVQEVNSFLKNFDINNWNDIIFKLTIIGIRFLRTKYHNFYKWSIEDLNLVSEQLKHSKVVQNNFKSFYGNKYSNLYKRNENNEKYNYNYSNKSFFTKKSKDNKTPSSIKSINIYLLSNLSK